MDGDRGDLAELVEKKRNMDYYFRPQFTNKIAAAENNKKTSLTVARTLDVYV